MNIAVCLKLIADPDILTFDIQQNKIVGVQYALDPIGHHLLEASTVLRQQHGGTVTILSAVPEMGEFILRDALQYGADEAVRIWRDEWQGAETWLISLALTFAVQQLDVDLILCGTRSGDTASGLMVHALAHHLNMASATDIIAIEKQGDRGLMVVKKQQNGRRETYALKLPAVLGIQESINEPRYVAKYSKTYRKGMNRKITYLEINPEISNKGPLTKCLGITQPQPRVKKGIDVSKLSMKDRLKQMRGEFGHNKKELFSGSPEEAVKKIFDHIQKMVR